MAPNRKNALFAGSDGGGEHWATIASLIVGEQLSDTPRRQSRRPDQLSSKSALPQSVSVDRFGSTPQPA